MLDLLEKHLLLHTLVGGITPVELTFSFDHRFCCLLIRAELVNLNLSALVVEVGKTLERFCLAVELYDGLHDIRVVVPVLVAQEVASQDIDLGLAGILGKANDSLHVAAFQEAFETLHFLVGQGVNLSTEFEVALPFH